MVPKKGMTKLLKKARSMAERASSAIKKPVPKAIKEHVAVDNDDGMICVLSVPDREPQQPLRYSSKTPRLDEDDSNCWVHLADEMLKHVFANAFRSDSDVILAKLYNLPYSPIASYAAIDAAIITASVKEKELALAALDNPSGIPTAKTELTEKKKRGRGPAKRKKKHGSYDPRACAVRCGAAPYAWRYDILSRRKSQEESDPSPEKKERTNKRAESRKDSDSYDPKYMT